MIRGGVLRRSAATAVALAAATAAPGGVLLVAAGDFGTLAGYEPTTPDVTSWAILDLDQQSFEAQLKLATPESFRRAQAIFALGGHAGSYAVLDLDNPLNSELEHGRTVHGLTTSSGKAARGTAVGNYWGEETSVSILYHVPRDFAEVKVENMCMIGGLVESGEASTKGCYNATGVVEIANRSYKYTYDEKKDTYGHITLSSLSSMAMREMYRVADCVGCPYKEFVEYHDYYEDMAYGTHWVKAALEGTPARYLGRGDADFSALSLRSRADAAKKGTLLLSVYMYVLRNLRLAVAECRRPCQDSCDRRDEECVTCDTTTLSPALTAWDQAVALYVGSLEKGAAPAGDDDATNDAHEGQFLYNLAEDRCQEFRTCGEAGDWATGTANANIRIMTEFAEGQKRLASGGCNKAEHHLGAIWKLMAVPVLQGVLHYAHKTDEKTSTEADRSPDLKEKRNAEGATFAAAILPRLWACNADDAEVVYGNMRIGAMYTDFASVKEILEANYDCLGVTCEDVGGAYDSKAGGFYAGAEPCTAASQAAAAAKAGKRSSDVSGGSGGWGRAGAIAGIIIGLFVACGVLGCVRRRSGKGTTVSEIEAGGTPEEFASEGGYKDNKEDIVDNSRCIL